MAKKISQNIFEKITQYGAMVAAIGTVAETNGQVIYTDIVDFEGDSASSFELDLNGDGVNDFTINGSSIQILVDASSNSIAGSLGGLSYKYPFALNEGSVIDGNQVWQSSNGQILRYKTSSGATSCQYSSNWCGDTVDKYLGLRFDISGNAHYGWVRLDVTVPNSMDNWVVKDFAYEATPDTAISAGDGILNTFDQGLQRVAVVANGKFIDLGNLPDQLSYRLYNIVGQQIVSGDISENSFRIDLSTQSSGLYVLELSNNSTNSVIRKKLILN